MALVRCITGFTRGGDVVPTGEILDDSHPLVKTTPAEWWEPLNVRAAVEEATAKPGAKRRTTEEK